MNTIGSYYYVEFIMFRHGNLCTADNSQMRATLQCGDKCLIYSLTEKAFKSLQKPIIII